MYVYVYAYKEADSSQGRLPKKYRNTAGLRPIYIIYIGVYRCIYIYIYDMCVYKYICIYSNAATGAERPTLREACCLSDA